MSAMECAEVAAFTFTVRQIRWCLLWKFDSPKATVINLFEFCEYFVVGLGNWSEFCDMAVSSKQVQRSEGKF